MQAMGSTYVLDQNFLRSEELKRLVLEPEARFAILDEALMEMCKSPQWEETMRHSLATLAKHSAHTIVPKDMGTAMRWELRNKRSVDGQLVNGKATRFVNSLLEGIRAGIDSSQMVRMRRNIEAVQEKMREVHFNHSQNKADIVELVESTTIQEPQLAAALRKGRLSDDDRFQLLKMRAIQIVEEMAS
jgi:hypothetical protein